MKQSYTHAVRQQKSAVWIIKFTNGYTATLTITKEWQTP